MQNAPVHVLKLLRNVFFPKEILRQTSVWQTEEGGRAGAEQAGRCRAAPPPLSARVQGQRVTLHLLDAAATSRASDVRTQSHLGPFFPG